ncbi:MAG TPA: GlsB/YeaQ/YmgE family stress response membrane protein [Candidatus Limnocylindrales bacterium]|nr:GlsB/YeaQ/YmgE family stress response membrane protein [Candidatus Limnocylindrales bacterium]
MFGLIGTIIVGFIVGVIAKLIMPGKENMGFIMTTILGIIGSLVATYAGQLIGWYQAGQGAGWIGSIVGAFVVLWGYLRFKSNA